MRFLDTRLTGATLAGALFLSVAAPAAAQWPEKPIEMVCSTTEGSGAANWCHMMADLVGKELGTPISVLFKPGNNGNEGAVYIAGRDADGYTWLQRNSSYGGYMSLPGFEPDPQQFKVPVEVEKFLYVLAVPDESPYASWEQLVEGMKAADEPLEIAGNKHGSAHHLHLVRLFEAAGLPWKYVSYKGAGDAMRDTLSGQTDVAIGPPGIWMSHLNNGNARFLLLLNEERVDRPGLSDLPVPSDFGLDYPIIHQVQGVFTLDGTPDAVNDRIASAFRAVVGSDAYRDYVASQVHAVPQFSDDIDANTQRFHQLRGMMRKALSDAGLLQSGG